MRTPPMRALTFVKLGVVVLGVFNLVLVFRERPFLSSHSPSATEPRQIRIRNYPSLRLLHLDTLADRPRTLVTEETVHYPVQGPLADLEWSSLVPSANHGLVLLGPYDDVRPYAVGMFHALHCLDRIRKAIVAPPESPHARHHMHHCFNYLRQMALCAADTRLNPTNHVHSSGRRASDGIGLAYRCRDWNAVYEAFEANITLNRTLSF